MRKLLIIPIAIFIGWLCSHAGTSMVIAEKYVGNSTNYIERITRAAEVIAQAEVVE